MGHKGPLRRIDIRHVIESLRRKPGLCCVPSEVPVLEARGILQALPWDITPLPGPVKEQFFYLYMVMDVWSRRILAVEVHERECGELASTLFDRV